MADVSIEALRMIKRAFREFNVDCSKVSEQMKREIMNNDDACKGAIAEVERDLREAKCCADALKAEAEQHRAAEQNAENDERFYEKKAYDYKSEWIRLQQKRDWLIAKKNAVVDSKTETDSEKAAAAAEREELDGKIWAIQDEMNQTEGMQKDAEKRAREARETKEKEKHLAQDKETEYEYVMARVRRLNDKLNRMNDAYRRWCIKSQLCIQSIKKFERTASQEGSANLSALERCLALIEAYERMSF